MLRLWQALVFTIGFFATVAACFFIIQLTDLDSDVSKIKAAAAAAGVVVSGSLVIWVLRRRNEAKRDEEKWDKLVNSRCR